MTRTARRTIAVVVLILAVSGNGWGQHDSELSRETLRGLDGVGVAVENLEPEVERNGLTKSQLQTDVELKLRLAGINVLNEAGTPYLYINVSGMRNDGRYAYSVFVSFNQGVLLVRNRQWALASTWYIGGVGSVDAANLQQVRDDVKDHVDQFINAYLSVNPETAVASARPPPLLPWH